MRVLVTLLVMRLPGLASVSITHQTLLHLHAYALA
jgi:hypothetical protein